MPAPARPAREATRRPAAVTLLALLHCCAAAIAHPAPPPATANLLEYLYVDAGASAGAGGHTALRFDDQVYHFQHHELGTLRLSRMHVRDFQYRYTARENRSIRSLRIAVSADTYEVLRDHFNERYLVEERQFALLDSLRGDRELLKLLLERSPDAALEHERTSREAIYVEAAGYFFGAAERPSGADPRPGDRDRHAGPDSPSAPEHRLPPTGAVARLRARVAATRGPDFLERRQGQVREALHRLTLALPAAGDLEPAAGRYPEVGYALSSHYRDLVQQITALDVLARARPLRPETSWRSGESAFRIDDSERRKLRRFARRLEGDLVTLLDSGRPDWGLALLVGMARLEALDASERLGRLVLLDSFREGIEPLDPQSLDPVADGLASRLDAARRDFQRARAGAFGGEVTRERDYARLEGAANQLHELREGLVFGRPFRAYRGRLWPSRGARRTAGIRPAWDAGALERALAQARENEEHYARGLAELYRYDLVTRNCVSEIFRTIEASLVANGTARGAGRDAAQLPKAAIDRLSREESIRRLGGHVRVRGSLNFIPFVSAGAVARHYRVSSESELLSHRKARLEAMYADQNPLVVYLRESNTLTSTVYHRSGREPFFLFFTDDRVVLRPIFGALNLVAGLSEALVGVVRAPFDRGATLRAGAWGALFSLPELAFFNIRKGSMPHASRPDS